MQIDRFVELAAKYGFTDDGLSITGSEEEARLQREINDGAAVSNGNTKRKPQTLPASKPAAGQSLRKVAPKNQLSSIEVYRQKFEAIHDNFTFTTF